MSAPSEYYRKVVEVSLLRTIINDARACRLALPAVVDNSDLEGASLEDLNEIYEDLMGDIVDAVFDADGLPSSRIPVVDDIHADTLTPDADMEQLQLDLDRMFSETSGAGAFFIKRRGEKIDAVSLFERVSSEVPNVRTLSDLFTAHDRMVHDFLSSCECGPDEPIQFELYELTKPRVS